MACASDTQILIEMLLKDVDELIEIVNDDSSPHSVRVGRTQARIDRIRHFVAKLQAMETDLDATVNDGPALEDDGKLGLIG